jgi:hypothetical protein
MKSEFAMESKSSPLPASTAAAPPRIVGSQLLAWILALQILTLVGQWTAPAGGGGAGGAATALAQVPDAGEQRLEIIDQLKGVNDKLGKLADVLTSGDLQVTLTKPPEKKTP